MGSYPRLARLNEALYRAWLICGRICKWWFRRPKLTSSVISDVKGIFYICFIFIYAGCLPFSLTPTEIETCQVAPPGETLLSAWHTLQSVRPHLPQVWTPTHVYPTGRYSQQINRCAFAKSVIVHLDHPVSSRVPPFCRYNMGGPRVPFQSIGFVAPCHTFGQNADCLQGGLGFLYSPPPPQDFSAIWATGDGRPTWEFRTFQSMLWIICLLMMATMGVKCCPEISPDKQQRLSMIYMWRLQLAPYRGICILQIDPDRGRWWITINIPHY